ncbi:acyl-CoA thioesterase II [Exophiala mesophila]|uniref:Acyl-CoA thioesterase II n=1 Tax=Exophiala mesophila TaxID=212818 RepID=A0A0D1ZHT9_EXOME|nr:acyl-CoA thioesterase II [Exophiala mesophila]KIV94187.1 acyl-CoA thioesterase II [Exophiala mesophila]
MMAEAAAAAYRTVPEGFVLDSLHTQFLIGPKADKPLIYRVQRLSQGRRFAVRVVTIEQDGKAVVTSTISFMSGAAWSGKAFQHTTQTKIQKRIKEITLDDFEGSKTDLGPFMKFERLPHEHATPKEHSTTIAPVVAKIDPPMRASTGDAAHILAVIHMSDYHVMDCPLGIHEVNHGQPKIGDYERKRTPFDMKIMTSLNHTIHFHVHGGFRADDLLYVEVTSPWARDGRGMIHSKIYTKDGLLIATCVQEAFYVFKDTPKL